MEVRILGTDEVKQRLDDMREAVKDAYVIVGTDVVYAPGIEYGRHPGGKLARKAGGSFALTDAFEEIKPRIVPELRWALAVKWAKGGSAKDLLVTMIALGNDVLTRTKELLQERVYSLPIPLTHKGKAKWARTGHLRRSYHMEVMGMRIGRGSGGNLRTLYSAASKVR